MVRLPVFRSRLKTHLFRRCFPWLHLLFFVVPVKWLVIIGHVNRSFYLLTLHLHNQNHVNVFKLWHNSVLQQTCSLICSSDNLNFTRWGHASMSYMISPCWQYSNCLHSPMKICSTCNYTHTRCPAFASHSICSQLLWLTIFPASNFFYASDLWKTSATLLELKAACVRVRN